VHRSAVEFYKKIFGYWPQQNLGPKIYLFSTTSQLNSNLRDNVSGEEHDIDNQETALKTTNGFLYCPKFSWTLIH